MAEEVSIYRDAQIQVTNLRAMLPGKTYAMANVTSVAVFTQSASKAPGILLAIFGGLIVLIGLPSSDVRGCAFFFGFVLLAIGVAYASSQKTVYWVRIGSASGETNALSSHDYDHISRIVNAMNEAIVQRG